MSPDQADDHWTENGHPDRDTLSPTRPELLALGYLLSSADDNLLTLTTPDGRCFQSPSEAALWSAARNHHKRTLIR